MMYTAIGTYTGELQDGKRHGQGTFTFASGAKYTGEVKDGLPNGQGTLIDPAGPKNVGDWKNGERVR